MADADAGQGPTEEQVNEARSLGWAPKESWKGDPEKWVDADQFLERGLGIHHLRAANTRLEEQLRGTTGRLNSLESSLKSAQATIDALEESHAEDVAAQVEAARTELKATMAQASRDGDHEALAEATDKLTQLNAANKEAGGKDDKNGKDDKDDTTVPPQIHPEVVQWFKDNPDYTKDRRRTATLNTVAAEKRQAGDTTIGKEFLDSCATEVDSYLGKPAGQRGPSKVEGGNGGAGRSSSSNSGGKTFADLPADAKAACDRQGQRLVGANRAHKDLNSWRAAYTKKYFEES